MGPTDKELVASPRAFLLRTATHAWIDTLRRRTSEAAALDRFAGSEANAGTAASAPVAPHEVRDAGTTLLQRLSPQEQGAIIREHSVLGRAYGDADLAHDVRLACHGLDPHDNDFVIGLVGRELHPLSHLVQTMRRTAQTSQYIHTLGPFFVGHVLWQSPLR